MFRRSLAAFAKGKGKREFTNAWEAFDKEKKFPDPNSFKLPKKLWVSIHHEDNTIVLRDRINEMNLQTDDGEVTILPGHEQSLFKLPPGLITLKYTENKIDKWFHSGGYAFVYFFGPVDINCADVYKLDDIDVGSLKKEIEKQKEIIKAPKNERQLLHAKIAMSVYTPLARALDIHDF